MSESHAKPDILIAFVFGDNEYMFLINQTQNSGSLGLDGKMLNKGPCDTLKKGFKIVLQIELLQFRYWTSDVRHWTYIIQEINPISLF